MAEDGRVFRFSFDGRGAYAGEAGARAAPGRSLLYNMASKYAGTVSAVARVALA